MLLKKHMALAPMFFDSTSSWQVEKVAKKSKQVAMIKQLERKSNVGCNINKLQSFSPFPPC